MKLFRKNSNLCDHNSPTLQTDRQTTCDGNTSLCTKVHRAVKSPALYLPIFGCKGVYCHFEPFSVKLLVKPSHTKLICMLGDDGSYACHTIPLEKSGSFKPQFSQCLCQRHIGPHVHASLLCRLLLALHLPRPCQLTLNLEIRCRSSSISAFRLFWCMSLGI